MPNFFLCSRYSACTARSGAPPSHRMHQTTRFGPRMSLFGGPINMPFFRGEIPQNSSFWSSNTRFSSINFFLSISLYETRTRMFDSSKRTFGQEAQCTIFIINGRDNLRGSNRHNNVSKGEFQPNYKPLNLRIGATEPNA